MVGSSTGSDKHIKKRKSLGDHTVKTETASGTDKELEEKGEKQEESGKHSTCQAE